LVTSFVGAGPLGGVTVGSVDSGPLVGVLTVAVAADVEVGVLEVAVASVESEVFSLPTPIVPLEELLEPQPAISTAAPSVARTVAGRGEMLLK
jgi:hypothetical protein